MPKVLVLGGGRIGSAIATLLSTRDKKKSYDVTVGDSRDADPYEESPYKTKKVVVPRSWAKFAPVLGYRLIGTTDEVQAFGDFCKQVDGYETVVSALPYYLTQSAARAAFLVGANYFDLTEDVKTTKAIKEMADNVTGQVFMPQCGLAPGATAIIGNGLCEGLDEVWRVEIRVGALPRSSSTRLGYAITWSPDGLINEYLMPCEAIVNGELCTTTPLDGLERLAIGGEEYEAFNTSGGLGTLCHSMLGRVLNCNYKTIRYRGHCDAMRLLLWELRLHEQGDALKRALEANVPGTANDVVLFHCSVTGSRNGRPWQKTYFKRIVGDGRFEDLGLTAIEKATACSACAAIDIMSCGDVARKGFVRQEDIPMPMFLSNQYGSVYAEGIEEERG